MPGWRFEGLFSDVHDVAPGARSAFQPTLDFQVNLAAAVRDDRLQSSAKPFGLAGQPLE